MSQGTGNNIGTVSAALGSPTLITFAYSVCAHRFSKASHGQTRQTRARATKWIDVHALCVFSAAIRKKARCAIYTRKSSEEGLEQAFNSLDAQREACAAFILSQKHEGWTVLPALYDDGGFSGGTMERPALKRLRSVAMTNSPYPPYYM
jgi:hypothetical protein